MENLNDIIGKLKNERFFREKSEKIKSLEIFDRIALTKNELLFLKINGENVYPIFKNGDGEKELLIDIVSKGEINGENGRIFYRGEKIDPEEFKDLTSQKDLTTNTILTGKNLFIKFYRELNPHSKREGEILKEIKGCFKNIPEYLGTVSYEANGKEFPLFLILRKIDTGKTLWKYLMGSGKKEIIDIIKKVGDLTANLHICLTRRWVKNLDERFKNFLIGDVEQILKKCEAKVEKNLPEIKELIESIREIDVEKTHFPLSQIHGDYHLEQIIYDGRNFYITDFEGEPILFKNQFFPILYDVSGMIRSFDYFISISGIKDPSFNEMTEAFISKYFLTIKISPSREDIKILSLLILRKNLYEIVYEMNNRPQLLHIPVDGLNSFFKVLPALFKNYGA